MKTFRNLYPQVIDFENLYLAYRKARRGKRERPEVAEYEFDLEANLFELLDSAPFSSAARVTDGVTIGAESTSVRIGDQTTRWFGQSAIV